MCRDHEPGLLGTTRNGLLLISTLTSLRCRQKHALTQAWLLVVTGVPEQSAPRIGRYSLRIFRLSMAFWAASGELVITKLVIVGFVVQQFFQSGA